jgi:predicted nucleic acid-binding protein
MNGVFADAFYYIALSNRADQYHAAAMQATRALKQRIVTTQWVLMEVGDALSAPEMRVRTHALLTWIAADPQTSVVADSVWYERGLALYGNREDKEWSLTDCVSFEVMAERGITDALTGDHHFVQAGFRALLLPDS